MSVSVCECLLCLLPSLLLLLLSLGLRWPRAQLWLRLAARAAAWRLWLAICWVLELPLNTTAERAWNEERGPAGTGDRPGPEQSAPQHWPRGVACKPTALARHLFQHCGSLALPRPAAWPRGDPHIQTLRGLLWGSCDGSGDQSRVQFSRDHLLLRDGGTVALDWAVATRRAEAVGRKRAEATREREHQTGTKALGCFTSTPPVLLLIPQFWGGLTPHLKELCHLALCQGFYAVVVHPRGTAGCPLTAPRLTEFGDPSDLEQAVAYVHNCHPSSVLLAVSEGSGSGVLLSYLGECGSSSHLTAAAAISPVLQGQLWFQTPMPPIYRWGALIHRKLQLSRYATAFSAAVDVDRILCSSSLRDYEEALFCSTSRPRQTAPSPRTSLPSSARVTPPSGVKGHSEVWAVGERAYPAKDWDGYWERNEPLRDADEVAVPVLCICSRDDPLLPPASTMPLSLFQSNPYFLLVTTDTGGHCGFAVEEGGGAQGGPEKATRNWSHTAILEYFRLVADFLKEERRGARWEGAMVGREGHGGQGKSRPGTMPPPCRRRGTAVRRTRPQTQQIFEGEESGEFTWRRSYTR